MLSFLFFLKNVCVVLSLWEVIGLLGVRNFMLCEKLEEEKKKVEEEDNGRRLSFFINGVRKRSFRVWINKFFSFKVIIY